MKRKILIGSILVVTVLILVTFTTVVGYDSQTLEIKDSPLFNIRTSRATENDCNILSCEYIGKETSSFIGMPKRNYNATVIQMAIRLIRNMDESEFNEFVSSLQNRNYLQLNNNNEGLMNNKIVRENIIKNITCITAAIPLFLCQPHTSLITFCEPADYYCFGERIFYTILIIILVVGNILVPILEFFSIALCTTSNPLLIPYL